MNKFTLPLQSFRSHRPQRAVTDRDPHSCPFGALHCPTDALRRFKSQNLTQHFTNTTRGRMAHAHTFAQPTSRLLTFLDFPPTVRERIYLEAGLEVDKVLRLSRVTRVQHDRECSGYFSHPTIASSLLRCCRAVHDEVLAMVLSQNTLLIEGEENHLDYGLDLLRRLTPDHCAAITNLHVSLRLLNNRCRPQLGLYHEDKKRHLSEDLVTLWQEAASHLLAHIKPNCLKLTLICDRDTVTGENHTLAVTHPFREHPGKLKDLQLRLAEERDSGLCILAAEVVARATGDLSNPILRKGVFRFLDLPAEIRMHILECTDLVTPYRNVEWNPSDRYHCQMGPEQYLHYDLAVMAEPPCRVPNGAMSDICTVSHSACYSGCHCWAAPSYLMLVSRAVYHDAQAVFFANNRVSIVPSEGCTVKKGTPIHRLDVSRFLTMHTWPGALYNLKELEFAFWPTYYGAYDNPEDPAYLDWTFALQHLTTHCNLRNLTLAIYLIRRQPWDCTTTMDACRQRHHAANGLGRVSQRLSVAYQRLLAPLKSFNKPKRLFVYLEVPWPSTGPRFDRYWPAWEEPATRQLEISAMKLEKYVMGEDYDSQALSKSEWRHAKWLEYVQYVTMD